MEISASFSMMSAYQMLPFSLQKPGQFLGAIANYVLVSSGHRRRIQTHAHACTALLPGIFTVYSEFGYT